MTRPPITKNTSLEDLRKCADEMRVDALARAAKLKNPRFRKAREYWLGYAQAAANLRSIAYGHIKMEDYK